MYNCPSSCFTTSQQRKGQSQSITTEVTRRVISVNFPPIFVGRSAGRKLFTTVAIAVVCIQKLNNNNDDDNNNNNKNNNTGRMTKGRTVLIAKDPQKGSVPSNYRPVTILAMCSKLLMGIWAGEIYYFMEAKNVLPEEQRD